MFDIKGIRTFATNAKDLDKAVEFYTKVIGGQIVKKVEPTEEQKKAGQPTITWVSTDRYAGATQDTAMREATPLLNRLRDKQIDGIFAPEGDPHHTLNSPWQEQEKALSGLKQIGANIEKVRPHRDSDNYSINVFDPDGNRWELSFAKGN